MRPLPGQARSRYRGCSPNDDTTECSAIKIHDPRRVKPVTDLNVYVPPIEPSMVGTIDSILFLPTTLDNFVLGDFNAHSSTW